MDVQEGRSSPGCVHGPKRGIQVKLLMRRWQNLWKLPLQWPCSPPGLDLYFLLLSPVPLPWASYLPKQEHPYPNFSNYPVTPKPMPMTTSPHQTNSGSGLELLYCWKQKKKKRRKKAACCCTKTLQGTWDFSLRTSSGIGWGISSF